MVSTTYFFADNNEKYLFSHDLHSMLDATNFNGVVNGLTVTERGAGANMSVDVASGFYRANGSKAGKITVTNVVITASDATNNRYDIIQADSSGNITVKTGTASATPLVPDQDANKIRLAIILVSAGVTSIVNSAITNTQIFILEPSNFHPINQYRLELDSFHEDTGALLATIDVGGAATYNTAGISGTTPNKVIQLEQPTAAQKTDLITRTFSAIPTKNPKMSWLVLFKSSSTTGVATYSVGFAADKLRNTPTHYAHVKHSMTGNTDNSTTFVTKDGTTEQSTVLTTLAGANWHNIEIELKTGAAFCYIDGSLVAVHTINVPTSAQFGIYELNHTSVADGTNSQIGYMYFVRDI